MIKIKSFQNFTLITYILLYAVQGNSQEIHRLQPSDKDFWYCVLTCMVLVCFSGFCSGATQGLLSIDILTLEIKKKQGTAQEKQLANIIFPVIEQHHLLLTTLLISNATANESLPIFLHLILPDWAAILVSAFFVVLLGEVVPSAFTTGPEQLTIAVKMIPYVKILQSILYIICYPLSLFLDWLMGVHQDSRYHKKDLRALIHLHGQQSSSSQQQSKQQNEAQYLLSQEQLQLINSTMDLRDELITKQSIELSKVFMVSSHEKYSSEFVHKIRVKGFSRIPVYSGQDKQQIMGTFNTKSILKYSESDYGKPVKQLFQIETPLIVIKNTSMLDLLIIFQEKRKTIAFVSDVVLDDHIQNENINRYIINPKQHKGQIIAIICLNDIFEEMLDQELRDDDIHGTLRNDPFDKNKDKLIRQNNLRTIREEIFEGVERGIELPLLKK